MSRPSRHDAYLGLLTRHLGAPLEVAPDGPHRWRACPVCGGDTTPPETVYLPGWHPLVLRLDGHIACERCESAERLILTSLSALDDVGYWRYRALTAEAKLTTGGHGS